MGLGNRDKIKPLQKDVKKREEGERVRKKEEDTRYHKRKTE